MVAGRRSSSFVSEERPLDHELAAPHQEEPVRLEPEAVALVVLPLSLYVCNLSLIYSSYRLYVVIFRLLPGW